MAEYVNAEAFLRWYDRVSRRPAKNTDVLLNEVLNRYSETKEAVFALPGRDTQSGREERYPYRFEDIGCCGASSYYFYF